MLMKKLESGFTVVELLIAIGLFGLVAPSIVLGVLTLNQVNDRAADLTLANSLAENKLEGLRSAGYNSLSVGSTTDFTSDLPATFTEPRSASYAITEPTTGLRRIDITIQYTDHSISRTLHYSSLMSELGVSQ